MKRNDFFKTLGLGAFALTSCKNELSSLSPDFGISGIDLMKNSDFESSSIGNQLLDFTSKLKSLSEKYSKTVYEESVFYRNNFVNLSNNLFQDKSSIVVDIFDKNQIFEESERIFKEKKIKSGNIEKLSKKLSKQLSHTISKEFDNMRNDFESGLKNKVKERADITLENFKSIVDKSFSNMKDRLKSNNSLTDVDRKTLESNIIINETFPEYFPKLLVDITTKSYENFRSDKQVDSVKDSQSWWSDFWYAFGNIIQAVFFVSIVIAGVTVGITLLAGATILVSIGAGLVVGAAVFTGVLVGLTIAYVINEP